MRMLHPQIRLSANPRHMIAARSFSRARTHTKRRSCARADGAVKAPASLSLSRSLSLSFRAFPPLVINAPPSIYAQRESRQVLSSLSLRPCSPLRPSSHLRRKTSPEGWSVCPPFIHPSEAATASAARQKFAQVNAPPVSGEGWKRACMTIADRSGENGQS